MISRDQQIAHINQHIAEFRELTGRTTVEEYFDEYYKKYENSQELYIRLCSDLNLVPR